jgi:hypothetical protein
MKNLKEYLNEITIGTKLKLSDNKGKVREYIVKEIDNNKFKLFNKFVVSFWVDMDYIEKHKL